MSETTPFCAGLRMGSNTYPGGFIGIVYENPEARLDFEGEMSLFKVELTEEKSREFLSRVWNMQEWVTSFSWSVDFEIGAPPDLYAYGGEFTISGKYTGAAFSGFLGYETVPGVYSASARSLTGEPVDRVSGRHAVTQRTNEGVGDVDSHSVLNTAFLCPSASCGIWYASPDPTIFPWEFTLEAKENEDADAVGSARFNLSRCSFDTSIQAEFQPRLLWVKNDGTVTVYFSAFGNGSAGGEGVFYSNMQYDGEGARLIRTDEISVFGVGVPVQLWENSDSTGNVYSADFSFSFDVVASELFTYPA